MSALDHFIIPYKGMRNGNHNVQFEIDDAFFDCFEESHVKKGNIIVDVHLDKRFDHSILEFKIDGSIPANCDRCLEAIHLPLIGEYRLHLKHSEDGEDNDEIVFIHPDTSQLNLAPMIYEFILLSVPMTKVYDCDEDEDPPCNFDLLDRLDYDTEDEKKDSTVWDSLKGMSFDD